MSESTAGDNATMVFNALSDTPVSAKSVQVGTGLTYRQVTDALEVLEARGTAVRQHVGTRTLWAIASADAPAEPLSDAQMDDALTVLADALDAEPVADADAEDDPLADIDVPKLIKAYPWLERSWAKKADEMTVAALVHEANTVHGLNLPKSTKKADALAAVRDARVSGYKAWQERVLRVAGYANLGAPALKALAKERKLPGYTGMKKADLVRAFDEADSTPAPEPVAPAAETAAAAPAPVDGPWGTPDGSTEPTDAMDAVLADLQATAPVSAPPARRNTQTREGRETRPSGGIVSSGTARAWSRGELETTLVARMAAVPDAEHSATTLTKWWNEQRAADAPFAQGGSVAFALDQAVKRGTVRLTQDKPKRYAAVQPALAQ